MKKSYVLTVLGPDSPGAINALAQTTRAHGGEWLTSKVIKLDGQFAALMRLVVAADQDESLREVLAKEFPAMQFLYADGAAEKAVEQKTVSLVVDCKDRPGLTKDINAVLANLDLKVEHMEFNRFHVSSIGEAMFSARIAISAPENWSNQAIAEEIEAIADDVRVDVA